MKKGTINHSISEILKQEAKPLRVNEIYTRIVEDGLYEFNAANPQHIVRTMLRRHSDNIEFPSASKTKYFVFLKNGTFWLKGVEHENLRISSKKKGTKEKETFIGLKRLHDKYLNDFKQSLLIQLKELEPTAFEEFCKRLVVAYGFKNVKVTRAKRDGGIDGYGELKIGLASMKVAFECKRWITNGVGRPKVSQFRGDIQGKFQQGIYFTTSKFSNEAKNISLQSGAVPIILIDGLAIVDLMIDKKFGVEVEELPIYTNALDLILNDIN